MTKLAAAETFVPADREGPCCHIPVAGTTYTTTPQGYMEIGTAGTGRQDLRP